MAGQPQTFEDAKARLQEIADAVSSDEMPLDEALDLFEEAVALGLAVSDLIEEGIVVDDPDDPDGAGEAGAACETGAAGETDAAEQGAPE